MCIVSEMLPRDATDQIVAQLYAFTTNIRGACTEYLQVVKF
jgi:hypothetical protein